MQRAIVDLPQPDSPTTPSVSPSRRVKRDAVDRLHGRDLLLEDDPARDREVLLQVLDDEQLVGRQRWLRHRGRTRARGLARLRLLVEVAGLLVRRIVRGDGEHRLSLAADVHRVRAARVEPAAHRRIEQRRRLARDLGRGARRSMSSRGSEPIRPQVYGCRGSLKIASTEPCSTILRART